MTYVLRWKKKFKNTRRQKSISHVISRKRISKHPQLQKIFGSFRSCLPLVRLFYLPSLVFFNDYYVPLKLKVIIVKKKQ